MIKYDGMKSEEQQNNNVGQLPAGPYVAKVIDAKIEGTEPDQQLKIAVDVSEGPFEGFFMKKFNAQKASGSQYGEAKYKGVIKLRIPNPNNKNALYPDSDKRRFNDMLYRFEKSNPGAQLYGQNGFDEQRLKGLTVGISMQDDEFNGNAFTRIARFEIADDVRQGLVKVMAPRKRKDQESAAPAGNFTPVEVEMPF